MIFTIPRAERFFLLRINKEIPACKDRTLMLKYPCLTKSKNMSELTEKTARFSTCPDTLERLGYGKKEKKIRGQRPCPLH